MGQADESSGWTDILNASTDAETAGMSDSDNAGTYLGAGGTRGHADVTRQTPCRHIEQAHGRSKHLNQHGYGYKHDGEC